MLKLWVHCRSIVLCDASGSELYGASVLSDPSVTGLDASRLVDRGHDSVNDEFPLIAARRLVEQDRSDISCKMQLSEVHTE